jgi:hypothetical protein
VNDFCAESNMSFPYAELEAWQGRRKLLTSIGSVGGIE